MDRDTEQLPELNLGPVFPPVDMVITGIWYLIKLVKGSRLEVTRQAGKICVSAVGDKLPLSKASNPQLLHCCGCGSISVPINI